MGITLEAYKKKLKELQEAYRAKLPEKLTNLDNSWRNIRRGIEVDQNWKLLYHVAHKLAGSAATMGLPKVSEIANRLQILVSDTAKNNPTPKEDTCNAISDLIIELKSPAALLKNDDIDLGTNQKDSPEQSLASTPTKVLIVDDDETLAESMALQLETWDFSCTVLTSLDSFEECVKKTNPDYIIMDMTFPENKIAGAQAIDKLKKTGAPLGIVIFHSSNTSAENRHEAKEAGGDFFVGKPTIFSELLLCLNKSKKS